MRRSMRMELWLALMTWAMGRALNLAIKNEDLETVKLIEASTRPWVEGESLGSR